MFDLSIHREVDHPHIRVALDLETHLITPTIQAPPPVAMGFSIDGGKVNIVAANDPAFNRVIASLFADPSCRLFGHGLRFDIAVLLAHVCRSSPEIVPIIFLALHRDRVHCTLIQETLYHIALAKYDTNHLPVNLGAACARWGTKTQPDKSDAWRQKYATLVDRHVSQWPEDAVRYLTEDVRAVDELYVAQRAKHAPWLLDTARQTRASVAFYLMQCWGFRSDPVQAAKLYASTEKALHAAAVLCKSTVATYVDAKGRTQTRPLRDASGKGNLKAVAARMTEVCEHLGIDVLRGKPTEGMLNKDPDSAGNIKVDAEACERTHDAALIAYSESGQAAGLLGKVKRWSMPVLQPSYETIKATGRSSVRQGSDPAPGEAPKSWGVQAQNPPKAVLEECPDCAGVGCKECGDEGEIEVPGIREIMVARARHVLLDIDFTGAEQCTLAQMEMWLFGESDLAQILNDPKRSALVELGARIIGVSAEEGYALKKSDPPRFKEMRSVAKGPAYGLPGGMGWKKLIEYCWKNYRVKVSAELAKRIVILVKKEYRQRAAYLKVMDDGECPANAAGAQVTRGFNGWRVTHPYSKRVRGGVGYTDGNNGWFQALAADGSKESTWRVAVECYAVPESPLYGARPLANIHDQLLVETPEDRYEAAAKRLQVLWVGGMQDICPDVLIQAEPAACRRWSKAGGEAKRWPDGRLAIYEDFLAAQPKK